MLHSRAGDKSYVEFPEEFEESGYVTLEYYTHVVSIKRSD